MHFLAGQRCPRFIGVIDDGLKQLLNNLSAFRFELKQL
jgi:hypothetical protein